MLRKSFAKCKFRQKISLLLLMGTISYPALSADIATTNHKNIQAIIEDYDQFCAQSDPISASERGDNTAAERWPDNSPAAEKRNYEHLKKFHQRLEDIKNITVVGEERINIALIKWSVDLALQGYIFDEDRIPFTNDEGFFEEPGYAAEDTILHSEGDVQHWFGRMRALPEYYDQQIQNMRRGIKTGFVQPRLIASNVAQSVQAMADTPVEQNALLRPLESLPASFTAERRRVLKAEAETIVRERIKPSERALALFFQKEYVPASRTTLGVFNLPNGRAYYEYRVKSETTTDMTPDQVFALGLSEIDRIHKEMDIQMKAVGFHGSFKEFVQNIKKDPRFYVTTREALMEKASRLAKEIDNQLPRVIGKLPRLTYGVREVPHNIEEGYTTGRYDPGSPALGVSGGLMINTSHLNERPLYELPSLVAHEGVPGHHIQIALAQEMDNLPGFRRDYETTAFVEGWALYSEQLVSELGMYPTAYERFGLLSMEMWRACRLVIDVGIHWKGWTRNQAVDCLRDNTALAEKNIQNEVNRYIAWPGQALGYKVGELTIIRLRHQAEDQLGGRFDERRFHDVILDEGAMPMKLLEERVGQWIKEEKGRPVQ